MGEVYPGIERKLARSRGVQAAVRDLAEEIAGRSRAILAEHHSEVNSTKGTSPTISTDHSGVDSLVILEDEDGGAAAIEFGREGGGKDSRGRRVGPMEPIAPLRGAIRGPQ